MKVHPALIGIACLSVSYAGAVPAATGLSGGRLGKTSSRCSSAKSWSRAKSHIGSTVTLRGPVRSTKYAQRSSGQPTFLNVGKAYPSSGRLQVVIWGRDRRHWSRPPEATYSGRKIAVRGQVRMYRGVPEVFADQPSDIAICG
jgi:DNA/RNA endonuclease YhcR with UshA esterase domain